MRKVEVGLTISLSNCGGFQIGWFAVFWVLLPCLENISEEKVSKMDWRRREVSLLLGWLQETKFHFWYRREGTWGVGEKFRKLPLDERDRSKVVNPPGAQKPPDEL